MKSDAAAPFRPLEWQVPPLNDKSLVLLLTGSAGGGKSRVAAEKVHAYCMKYPGSTWLIMRKAREWNTKSILPFYNQSVVGRGRGVTFLKSDGQFVYDNGSIVYSGGMKDDDQREAIRSIGGQGGLDGAWMEEGNAFSREDYEEVLGRLRGNAGGWRQLIISTNPGPPRHWIYTDLIKGNQAHVYYSKAADNPNNPNEYLSILDRLTGTQRKRLVEGLWVQAEGAVYDTFDYATHVTERDAKDFVSWYIAEDEGYTNPAVILLIGEDSDGRWHVSREFYKAGVLQGAIVKTTKEWQKEKRTSFAAVDEAAAGLIADLQSAGVRAVGAKGRVLDGIQTIQNRLKVQGDGKPRLTISAECPNLIGEFESYTWKRTPAGIVRDEPEKQYDHALDALRYFAVARGEKAPPLPEAQIVQPSKWTAEDNTGWSKRY